jgi:hypothetical protein
VRLAIEKLVWHGFRKMKAVLMLALTLRHGAEQDHPILCTELGLRTRASNYLARSASARWPASVIPTRVNSIARLLASIRLVRTVARPSRISSADGVLRLDTRTGQVSQCSRSDVGWVCKVVPDERSALETEILRLQGENATLKKELLAHGLPIPGIPSPSGAAPGERELKLPSDAEVDKVISFLEKVWRRLIEMGRTVQKDVERKN